MNDRVTGFLAEDRAWRAPRWRRTSTITFFSALTLASLALLIPQLAKAEVLPVSAVKIRHEDHYRLDRVYAGQLRHVRQSELGFEFGGTVAEVRVDEGDVVPRGAILVRLETRSREAELKRARADLETAKANIVAQRAQLDLSAASLKRQQDLVERGHGSAQAFDERKMQYDVDVANVEVLAARLQSAIAQVELAESNLDKLTIRAPFDGKIQARHLDEGTIAGPGQSALTIVEEGRLEARVGIPRQLIEHVIGDETYVLLVDDREVEATLAGLLPVADQITGAVTAIFHTEAHGLYAGTLTELVLAVEVPEPGYWLPLAALSESQRGLWSVLVVNQAGAAHTVESRLVEIVYRGRDRVFVRGTLQDGELVVSGGTGRIVAGQEVRLTEVKDNLGPGAVAAK